VKRRHYICVLLTIVSTVPMTAPLAGPDPIPITAEEAFDAVQTGVIRGSRYGVGKIALVDVRTLEEYQFQGTPAKVDSILLKNGTSVVPDLGKARLTQEGKFIEYTLRGTKKRTQVDKVRQVATSPISVLVPCAKWDSEAKQFVADQDGFSTGMNELADAGVMVVITMCNSGGRSTQCPATFLDDEVAVRFAAIYEIDRPGEQYVVPDDVAAATGLPAGRHMAGLGGYNGSDYKGVYNGSVGFPGRQTDRQPVVGWPDAPSGPSVSWKDSGLPVYVPDTACYIPPPAR
jgi:rhodanese-related sulfurtransferase